MVYTWETFIIHLWGPWKQFEQFSVPNLGSLAQSYARRDNRYMSILDFLVSPEVRQLSP